MPEPADLTRHQEDFAHTSLPGGVTSALPRPLTSFIGREADIRAVRDLFASDDARLVTLTGPGGVGKTRLAIRVAETADGFPDGIWFVPLASISDPDQVVPAIVNATGAVRIPKRSALENLIGGLREKSALLILDNFEQVLEAAPALSAVLSGCTAVRLLVTSRFSLNVVPEHVYAVTTLKVPEEHTTTGPETLFEHEAVRLFVERARARRPDFELTERNGPAVAAICRRLDGLPLGIELATARLTALSPGELLARLDARLGVLTGGARDQPGRLRSLRESIAWSYDLLSPEEQVMFRRLGVFAGPWTFAAAEAVVPDAGDASPVALLDGIASLVEKSLVRHQVMPDGTSQYQLLETIREYATGLLDASEDSMEVRRRLVAYLQWLVGESFFGFFRPDGAHLYARLDLHASDVWSSLTWLEQEGNAEGLIDLVGPAGCAWQFRGTFRDGRRWMERALELGRSQQSPKIGRMLFMLGMVVHGQGEERVAWELLQEALDTFTIQDDTPYLFFAVTVCGLICQRHGRIHEADVYQNRALALIPSMPAASWRPFAESTVLGNLGNNAISRGDISAAKAYFTRALDIQIEQGYAPGTSHYAAGHPVAGLGDVARGEGDHTAALANYQLALRLARDIDDYRAVVYAIGGVAGTLACSGQWQAAARLFGAAENLHRRGALPFDLETMDRQRGLGLPEPWFRGDEPFNSGGHIRDALWKDAPPPCRLIPDPEAAAELWRAGRALDLDEAVAEALAATLASEAVNDGWLGLSPREVEVLRLIVAGMTDAQIAEKLFVSRRTVASHLEHVYTKLGVSSRAAAAVWAVRNGLS